MPISNAGLSRDERVELVGLLTALGHLCANSSGSGLDTDMAVTDAKVAVVNFVAEIARQRQLVP